MIPVLFINMDNAIERRNWFENQGKRLGLDLNRIAAVDGRALPSVEIAELSASIRSGNDLGPAEIGCFLSHRKAWKAIVELDLPWAFVSEDDLHISADASQFFVDTSWIPRDADIVKPETTFRRALVARNEVSSLGGRQLRRLHSLHGGAGGYFLSRTAAEVLLSHSEGRCEPADHILFNPDFGFFGTHTIYQVDPAFAVQDLLYRGAKAGFDQSGLAHERRSRKRVPLLQKVAREAIRPIRKGATRMAEAIRAKKDGLVAKKIDCRLEGP